MARENKNKENAHYLTNYVTKLRRLNDIDLEIPQDFSIEEVIADPDAYAMEFIEREFTRYLPRFMEAYKLGQDLAVKNKAGG